MLRLFGGLRRLLNRVLQLSDLAFPMTIALQKAEATHAQVLDEVNKLLDGFVLRAAPKTGAGGTINLKLGHKLLGELQQQFNSHKWLLAIVASPSVKSNDAFVTKQPQNNNNNKHITTNSYITTTTTITNT